MRNQLKEVESGLKGQQSWLRGRLSPTKSRTVGIQHIYRVEFSKSAYKWASLGDKQGLINQKPVVKDLL